MFKNKQQNIIKVIIFNSEITHMLINDRVYGDKKIDDPLLIDLIKSKPVQRLKKINQSGASKYVLNKPISRYEHSVGVMLLLEHFGASIEEQAAGLLHDIPHTAFSHVIDFVFASKDHEFHERFFKDIFFKSEIPEILTKYGIDVIKFINKIEKDEFDLLEKEIPDLCADRLDYFLRELTAIKERPENARNYLENLIVKENKFIFKDPEIAKKAFLDFKELDDDVWANPFEIGLYQLLATIIKEAMDKNILKLEDLFEDDDFVYEKLKNSNDHEVVRKISLLKPGIKIINSTIDYDFFSRTKLRYIDPYAMHNGKEKRVSTLYPELKNMIKEKKNRIKNGFYLKIKGLNEKD